MKTKPFNIDEAKAGAKVVTREDNYPVEILRYDLRGYGQPILALVAVPALVSPSERARGVKRSIDIEKRYFKNGQLASFTNTDWDLLLVDESENA